MSINVLLAVIRFLRPPILLSSMMVIVMRSSKQSRINSGPVSHYEDRTPIVWGLVIRVDVSNIIEATHNDLEGRQERKGSFKGQLWLSITQKARKTVSRRIKEGGWTWGHYKKYVCGHAEEDAERRCQSSGWTGSEVCVDERQCSCATCAKT
ncbi:hypothetical protein BC629DRAFT_729760 [Irpex lacteus]|nr:hypothetical protein BC629DRAFT_729760 [Irpex lacteus]